MIKYKSKKKISINKSREKKKQKKEMLNNLKLRRGHNPWKQRDQSRNERI